jgi:DMSO/TMAO reductase YedYZ heme-binding membrane subunit
VKRAVVLSLVKWGLCVWCAAPAVDLWLVLSRMDRHFIRAYNYRVFSLGIADTGAWAFVFLLLALACTPVKRLTGWRWPGELRRILGLYAFFYCLLHFLIYMVIGQKLRWDYAYLDALSQPSRIPGWLSLLLLVPLVLTSTDGMVRRLGGKRWQQLHRLVYLATALAILHLAWTDRDNQVLDYHRTKYALGPFLALMALRFVPLTRLRNKLRTSISTRSSRDH